MDHLVLLVCFNGDNTNKTYKKLAAWAKTVNDARNDVAHRGLFSSTNKAKTIIAAAKSFITTLVPLYEPSFELKDK